MMIAQHIAVIAGEDDGRSLLQPQAPDGVEHVGIDPQQEGLAATHV